MAKEKLFGKIVDYGIVAVVTAWGTALGNALYETGKVAYLYFTEKDETGSQEINGANS